MRYRSKHQEKHILLSVFNFGGMAERSNAAVLKTVDVRASWGSNPYSSAKGKKYERQF